MKLVVAGTSVQSAEITLTTPPPPELTTAEIVAQKTRAPWLKKVSINQLSFVQGQNGEFSATGKAKVYVEHLNKRARLLVPVTIEGRYNDQQKYVMATLAIRHHYPHSPTDTQYAIERREGGEYAVFLALSVQATESKSASS